MAGFCLVLILKWWPTSQTNPSIMFACLALALVSTNYIVSWPNSGLLKIAASGPIQPADHACL